jgi:alanine racemase
MTRATHARVDTDALRHNLTQARKAAPGRRVMACIKANGYGHGMVEAARALSGADAFAVACIEEALEIRSAGLGHPVVLLEGVQAASSLEAARDNHFEIVVHDPSQLELIEAASGPICTWLKIDTGMSRLGFSPEDAPAARERLLNSGMIKGELRYMTHLASADVTGGYPSTGGQIEDFNRLVADWPGQRSIANSAGILAWPDSHADWVRPGAMLYGVSPFEDRNGEEFGLRPAMTVSTGLIAVKTIAGSQHVGYGGTWRARNRMRLGIAAIGYGDGYPRHAGNGTPVLINGRHSRLVGRVSMDKIAVDLDDHPEARVGDPVTLWGNGLPVEEVARHADTIAYELLCGVTRRVKFDVV